MTRQKMSLWVKSDHFGVLADVRYYPQSDRNSDQLNGRYVPLATKVRCSKKRLVDHLIGGGTQLARRAACTDYLCTSTATALRQTFPQKGA